MLWPEVMIMNKNERPAFLKGKGAAVGAVLCFVAVITMVGSYTYNHYKKDMEQQIKDAQTTAEQLTEDDSTLANTDDILPTDTDSEEDNEENQESQKDVQQENENSVENGNTSTEEIHLQIHRMCGLLRKAHLPGRQAEQRF